MAFESATLIVRMDRRVDELTAKFAHFVHAFDTCHPFVGPSVYFHECTVERLRAHASPSEALRDDSFVESLYAVLTAWGMHRIGSRGAKMADFGDFKASLLAQLDRIAEIDEQVGSTGSAGAVTLAQIPVEEVPALTRSFWEIIANLELGKSGAKIVIGSKALHHVFPGLLPPVDRRYTLRFFLDSTVLPPSREREAFTAIFERFHRIAAKSATVVDELLRDAPPDTALMRTSTAKMIDNAIIGYGIERLQIRDE